MRITAMISFMRLRLVWLCLTVSRFQWTTSALLASGSEEHLHENDCDALETFATGFCVSKSFEQVRHSQEEDKSFVRLARSQRGMKKEDKEGGGGGEGKEYPFHMKQIKADALHRRGFFGAGVVTGISSTGAVIQHEAVFPSYRGWNEYNQTFTHDYNWFDFFERTSSPVDTRIIGTFITGVVSGNNDTLNFGVAPKSKFMSCRVFDPLGRETPESQVVCLDFFRAPWDLNQQNRRPDLRPDVLLTSWCEGCTEGSELVQSIEALVSAGVFVVTGTGPRFPGTPACGKIVRPPTNFPQVFTASALGTDNVTLFSSAAGPALYNGRIIEKPDTAVIGDNIVSTVWDGESSYFVAGGSIVAGAVAAGGAALLLSALPEFKSRPDALRKLIELTADIQDSTQCDPDPTTVPNNEYGHGIMDLEKAYLAARENKNPSKVELDIVMVSDNGEDNYFLDFFPVGDTLLDSSHVLFANAHPKYHQFLPPLSDTVPLEFESDGFLFIRATVIDTDASSKERLAEKAISSAVFCWYNADFDQVSIQADGKARHDAVQTRIKENKCVDVTPCDKKTKRCKDKKTKSKQASEKKMVNKKSKKKKASKKMGKTDASKIKRKKKGRREKSVFGKESKACDGKKKMMMSCK